MDSELGRLFGFTDEVLPLERTLDLSVAADRTELAACASSLPLLRESVATNLDAYLHYFRGDQWRILHERGIVRVSVGEKRTHGFRLSHLLEVTRWLAWFKDCEGFDRLVEQFGNASQIESTAFEVEMAAWCATRTAHMELAFSPQVATPSGVKRPDMRWVTAQGQLYVECKMASTFESNLRRSLTHLESEADRLYKRHSTWRDDLRLDIVVARRTREFAVWLPDAIARAAAADEPGLVSAIEGASIALLPRDAPSPRIGEAVTGGLARVGSTATRLDLATYIRVTLSASSARAGTAARLVKEARRQVPPDGLGLIFIGLGSTPAAVARVSSLIRASEYSHIPFVAISASGGLVATWRSDFDGASLIEPIGVGP